MADLRPLILERDEYACHLCAKKVNAEDAQVDHIEPFRKFKKPVDAKFHITRKKMSSNLKDSILQTPYSDRQLIIVTKDEVAKAARDTEQKIALNPKEATWSEIGELALTVILPAPFITEITKEVIKAWQRA